MDPITPIQMAYIRNGYVNIDFEHPAFKTAGGGGPSWHQFILGNLLGYGCELPW